MRLVIMVMCTLLVAGVVATTLLAIWSTRRVSAIPTDFRQSLPEELGAAIPCFLLLAAAIPAVVALVSTRTGD